MPSTTHDAGTDQLLIIGSGPAGYTAASLPDPSPAASSRPSLE